MKEFDYNSLKEKLDKCKMVDIDKISVNEIDEIENIKIDKCKSSKERILDFLVSAKNPYCFKVGKIIVKFGFSNNNLGADYCITNVFKDIYK